MAFPRGIIKPMEKVTGTKGQKKSKGNEKKSETTTTKTAQHSSRPFNTQPNLEDETEVS